MLKNYKFYLQNLDCANCAKKIENKINEDKRFKDAVVNFNLLTLTFKTDISNVYNEVSKIIQNIEPDIIINEVINTHKNKDYELLRLVIALILLSLSFVFKNNILKEILLILSYILLLYKTAIKALKKIFKSHTIDENLLITISAIGAYLIGNDLEGIMVVLLYVIGKILEDKAVNKSRTEIKSLLDLKVNKAYLKEGDYIKEIPVEKLKVNDIVIVKKGESVPADGLVMSGNTMLDTSNLTGESVLQKATINTSVLSGSINKGDIIEVKITDTYYNSKAYKIFELTMNATNNKSKTETRVSELARYYTPIVLIVAIFIGAFLPLIFNITYEDSIYRALTFLVISCPCAIAISVPLSYFAGIGASSRNSALIKGSNFLDIINKCDTIIFDKTGTLTTGSFKLEKIISYDSKYSKEDIIRIIGFGEKFSDHPIAKVILNEITEELDISKVKNYQEIDGQGLSFTLNNDAIKVGSAKFVGTTKKANIFLSINDKLIGAVLFNDNVKENAKEVIEELKAKKIHTIMLTGDNKSFAKIVADKVGLDEYSCELLPDAKYQKLESIMNNHKVIFVGDGINDTPSLIKADVGISMGEIGTNSAIEASDIVLMNDNLKGILDVLKIAHKTNKIIMLNLIFAIATKLIILGLATIGYANMALAVFADTGVTLITILNSLRILKR